MKYLKRMVLAPQDVLEQALNAAAAVGMQDVADEQDRILPLQPGEAHHG